MPRRSDKKANMKIVLAAAVGMAAAIVGVMWMLATPDSAQQSYARELQEISDMSKAVTQSYEDAISKWRNGEIGKDEMLAASDANLKQLSMLLTKLKEMEPSARFKEGHELTVTSLEYELQSNEHMRSYIETGDESEYEESTKLFQLAFDYEAKAFQAFAKANGT